MTLGDIEQRKAEAERGLEQLREHGLKAFEDPDFQEWYAQVIRRLNAFHEALYRPMT
jgi:hypothetical protein